MPSSFPPIFAIFARIPKYLLRLVAIVLCLLGLVYAALFTFLQRDPQELVDKYLGEISARYGLEFGIGAIDITLLPLPAITLSDVQVKGKGLQLTTARLWASPSWLALLHGEIFPGEIEIQAPRLRLDAPFPLRGIHEAAASIQSIFADTSGESPELPCRLHVRLEQFTADVTGAAGDNLLLHNTRMDLRLSRSGVAWFQLNVGSLALRDAQKQTLFNLDGATIKGDANVFDFSPLSLSLQASGRFHCPGYLAATNFDFSLDNHSQGWNLQASVAGDLDLQGVKVPFALSGRAGRLKDGPEIFIRGVEWQLDADSGSANLALHWPGEPAQFALGGVLLVHRLSLTQWLGFARNLGPGLQIALDNIYDGRLEFMLNAKSLSVPTIRATCAGATFTGSGGVANFARPVVALNLSAANANLGLGLPEAVGETPSPIFFPHPTLTPVPDAPVEPGETGIGYDIRLGATVLRYGPLKIQKARVRIYPGKMDKIRLRDVLLDGSGQFYGGSVSGHCILGAHKSLPIYISAKASRVNAAPLGKDMPVLPMRKGIWNGSVTVNTRGKELKAFLGNMQGEAQVSAANATLAVTGAKNVFTSLTTSSKLRSGSWDGRHLTFDGAWRANVACAEFKASTDVNGKLLFGSDGLTFHKLPGSLTLRLAKSPLPEDTTIKLSGIFSGASSKNRYEVAQGELHLPGLAIKCDGVVDAAKFTARGKLSASVPNPVTSLAQLGFDAKALPNTLKPVKLEAEYLAQVNSLKLSEIKSSLGKISAAGSLHLSLDGKRPLLDTDLRLGQIVLNEFISSQPRTPNWDFKFLTTFDAKGRIHCAGLDIYGQKMTALAFPFSLSHGKLEIPELSAKFYGANFVGSLHADFNHGLSFESLAKVNGFNLESASRDRKLDIKLTGQADFQAATRAKLSGHDSLAPKLQGHWQFTVFNGSWQTLNKKGAPEGKAVWFKNTSASGTIKDGVVSGSNFQLRGPTIDITGGGWFSLPKQNLECKLNVDLNGLPAFPLTIYGPVNNIKTSIGAGKMFVNAVGDVAYGIAGAIGGVLKGAWNIFRR